MDWLKNTLVTKRISTIETAQNSEIKLPTEQIQSDKTNITKLVSLFDTAKIAADFGTIEYLL